MRASRPALETRALLARFSGARTTPEIRARARALARELRDHDVDAVRRALLALAGSGAFHPACELFEALPVVRATLSPRDLEALAVELEGWGSTDAFACLVAGHVWRDGGAPDALFERWARSKNTWKRRAALASTVPLNARSRGGSGDAARTLAICALLAGDREDLVVKALSWALRELGKREPAKVRAFLAKAGDRLAPRVRREVERKLATGRKNR